MNARALLLILGILIFNAPMLSAAAQSQSPLTTEAKNAFDWFDSLGFPDSKGKSFVLVTTEWDKDWSASAQNKCIYAFLLSEDADSFTVLATDLRVRTFSRTPATTPDHERSSFEIVELAKGVQRYSRFLQNQRDAEDSSRNISKGYLNDRGIMFVLAWSCWKNGLADLAQSLFEKAKDIENPDYALKVQPTLRELLERDLGYEMIWLTVLDAGNPAISRSELLRRFENVVKHYPASEYAKQAQELAVILKRMVREDSAHRSKPLEKLPLKEQVAELIYQLRNQNGHQISGPGCCDIFLDRRGKDSPAYRLVKIGLPAVPQLIKALDDDRLTRSVEYGRSFRFSHHILSIGDAALRILEQIAQRSFYKSSCGLPDREDIPDTRADVIEWWEDMYLKGEKRALIEAVAGADDNSYSRAKLLASRYPAAALPAIVRGIQNANNYWNRSLLVRAIGDLPGNEPVPFLLKEMNSSPFLTARVAAAQELLNRNNPEAVPAMIREWKTNSKSGAYELRDLIRFLAYCNRPEAIQTLAEHLSDRRGSVRSTVVETFYRYSDYYRSPFGLSRFFEVKIGADALSEKVKEQIEKTLVAELEDTDEYDGLSGLYSVADQRVCDEAAASLYSLWPDKYESPPGGSSKDRERQRIDYINIWRKSHSLEELPYQSPRPLPEHPNEVVEIRFSGSIPNSDLERTVKAVSGKILTSDDFMALFLKIIAFDPEWIAEFQLKAIRYDDHGGIKIVAELIRNEVPKKDAQKQKWHSATIIRRGTDPPFFLQGEKPPHAAGVIGDHKELTAADAYRKFKEAIDEALRTPPDSYLSISALFEPCAGMGTDTGN